MNSNFAAVCCITPLFFIFGIFIFVRSLGVFVDDRDIVCEGKPFDVRIMYSTRNNHRGWYLKYNLYFNNNNPLECMNVNNRTFQSSVYRKEETIVNISRSFNCNNTFVLKTFSTKTRNFLNDMTFLLSAFLILGCLFSCSVNKNSIEKQHLLSHV